MKDVLTKDNHHIRFSTFQYDVSGVEFTWYWAELAQIDSDGSVIGEDKRVSEQFLEKMRNYIQHPKAQSIKKGYLQGIYMPYAGDDRLFYKKGIYLLWADECCFLVCSSDMLFKVSLILLGV